MALTIVWTIRASKGFDNIVQYIDENWTKKEIRNFISNSNEFFSLLSNFPEILKRTKAHKNVHRGPMNKHTILTYRVFPRKNSIQLIN